jgi:hypothetical protein
LRLLLGLSPLHPSADHLTSARQEVGVCEGLLQEALAVGVGVVTDLLQDLATAVPLHGGHEGVLRLHHLCGLVRRHLRQGLVELLVGTIGQLLPVDRTGGREVVVGDDRLHLADDRRDGRLDAAVGELVGMHERVGLLLRLLLLPLLLILGEPAMVFLGLLALLQIDRERHMVGRAGLGLLRGDLTSRLLSRLLLCARLGLFGARLGLGLRLLAVQGVLVLGRQGRIGQSKRLGLVIEVGHGGFHS